MKKRINKTGIIYICILVFCIVVGILTFINENKEEKNKFTIWSNVDIEHEIYNQVSKGISYPELFELLKRSEANSSLSGKILKVKNISIDLSDKNNIKIREEGICEAFKQIDIQRNNKDDSEIIYKVRGKVYNTQVLKYKNGSYYLKNQDLMLFFILMISSLIFLAIVFWINKDDLYDEKIDNSFYSYDHYNKYNHF